MKENQRSVLKIMLACAGFSLCLGLLAAYAGLYIGIILLVLAAMLMVVVVIGTAAHDFFKKTDYRGVPLFISFSLLLGIFWAMPFSSLKNSIQEKEAKRIIVEIEAFKKSKGFYPEEIEKAGILSLYADIHYYRNERFPLYNISYDLNGWSSMHYSSESQTWIRDDD